ncbi:MAG: GNAT family N-acetyltransferase [Anaerorhabdus sp.]|uniref:GNAT family N-acetyltransferase n=1 Tax=Anaerorhabdus sp. TaxID=1872524 RepID=UPI002FC58CC9
MIRQCFEKDRGYVMEYLDKDRVLNLFFVGDIDNYGFENDFQKIFVDEEDGRIKAVYLIYHDSLLMCSYTKEVDEEFVHNVIKEYKIVNVNGEQSCIDTLDLTGMKNDDCYFCKMVKTPETSNEAIEIATVDDVEKIKEVIKVVFDQDSPGMKKSIEDKTGRTYFLKKDSKIVSVASSTAETKGLAMIVGVATLPEYRGLGYASEIMKKLCMDLLSEDKVPCLFYNNPAAGRIYHRIGFEDIGRWALRRNKAE